MKFALIFQTDSVLIDVSPLKYYKKYDFVGAPGILMRMQAARNG